MGTVHFGNDHFTVITRYGDYVQDNLMICHVYYVEDLGHNLFLVGQFCDGYLEVAFCSITFYVWNLEGEDLLTGSRDSNLYTISIYELATSSPVQRSLQAQVLKVRSDNGTEFKNEKLRTFYAKLGITHSTSIVRTPKQNGVVERRNQSSLVHTRYNKTPYELIKGRTPYELIKGRKPNVQYFHVFGSLCYPTNDRGDLRKMKSKVDIGIFIGYSESSGRTRFHLLKFLRFIRRFSISTVKRRLG
ncbi:integrase, catalytic region, zinc finger, CCHC-type containing protein [Tanacetum coccineum]